MAEEAKHVMRIAGFHVSNARPVVGEAITISGYLQWYDPLLRRWEPLVGSVKLLINWTKIKEIVSTPDGYFLFTHVFNRVGSYVVEARYDDKKYRPYEPPKIVVRVITEEQKKRMERMVRLLVAGIELLIVVIVAIAILLIVIM
jgi:hypothetical protein